MGVRLPSSPRVARPLGEIGRRTSLKSWVFIGSNPVGGIVRRCLALVTEPVDVLDLGSSFWEFESPRGHSPLGEIGIRGGLKSRSIRVPVRARQWASSSSHFLNGVVKLYGTTTCISTTY